MPAPRVRLPREKRVADIMVAARAVFAERGYDDAAMSEIAARVGIVEAALYRFFESKRDLLIQVICHWYVEAMASYESGLGERTGLRKRLRFVVWHHLTCIHESPEILNLFFGLVRLDPLYLDSELYHINRRYSGRVIEVLQEGIATGELRADAPLRLARDLIFGAAEHRTWAYRMGLSDFDPQAVTDEIVDAILAAFAPRPWRKRSAAAVARSLDGIAEQLNALAAGLATEEQ